VFQCFSKCVYAGPETSTKTGVGDVGMRIYAIMIRATVMTVSDVPQLAHPNIERTTCKKMEKTKEIEEKEIRG
jgi:hypothetical protein